MNEGISLMFRQLVVSEFLLYMVIKYVLKFVDKASMICGQNCL